MVPLPAHLSPAPAGRQRLDPEVRADHQRRRIAAAAVDVFAARGYRDAGAEHIAAAARVGVSTFYAVFAGKEECFLWAYEATVASWRERIAAAIPPAAPWGEQALAALRELLALVDAEPASARLLLLEAQTAGAAALARHEGTLASLPPLLLRARGLNPAAAELPDTLELATVGGVAWLLQERLGGRAGGGGELLAELVEIVVVPYLGEAEAARLLAAR